jgi:hypothetical protein
MQTLEAEMPKWGGLRDIETIFERWGVESNTTY